MKKLFALLAAAVMAVSLTACGGVDITRVGLPETSTLEKGATLQLEIDYGTDEDASLEAIAEAAQKLELVWTSSDEGVATVDASGLVTGVAGGEASITASIKDGNVSSSCKVTVTVPVTGVTASESLELVVNGEDSANVDAQLLPAGADGANLAYESSDEAVATVDANGVVTAVGNGECVITTRVTANEGLAPDTDADGEAADMVAETKVVVTTAATGIALDSTAGWIYVGGGHTLTPHTVPAEAPASTYTYTSSKTSVATVSASGVISGKAAGTATITVTSEEGFTTEYSITVKTKPVYTSSTGSTSGKTGSGGGTATKPSGGTAAASGGSGGTAAASGGGGGTATTPSAGTSSGGAATPTPAPAPAPAPAPTPGIVEGPGAGVGQDGNNIIGGGGTFDEDMGSGEIIARP